MIFIMRDYLPNFYILLIIGRHSQGLLLTNKWIFFHACRNYMFILIYNRFPHQESGAFGGKTNFRAIGIDLQGR